MYAQAVRIPPRLRHRGGRRILSSASEQCAKGCAFPDVQLDCIKYLKLGDPCCGSGGFFLAAQAFLPDPANYTLDRSQKEFLRNETFHGNEIVGAAFKTALMNLYLHNIGDIYGEIPITLGDALLSDPGYRVDY